MINQALGSMRQRHNQQRHNQQRHNQQRHNQQRHNQQRHDRCWLMPCFALLLAFHLSGTTLASAAKETADKILELSELQGGLMVHVGCGDGQVLAAIHQSGPWLVHGLDPDPKAVDTARNYLRSLDFTGDVSVDQLQGDRLPHIANLVNLLVVEDMAMLAESELLRVLCPEGVVLIKQDGQWTKRVKARPAAIDDWTHYLHDASNNAVAHDQVVAPPRRLQWKAGPPYSRHHDRMSSVSAVVSSGGKLFYIFDEASPASILFPPQWTLIARDAFNGTVLWKRPIEHWHTHLWPLKSGPAQLPRRLIAQDDRVYVTLGINAPFVCLDAATGQTIRTYPGTESTEEAILADGVLYLLVSQDKTTDGSHNFNQGYNATLYDESPRQIVAIQADTGHVLWSSEHQVLPATLASNGERVAFHNGQCVVCLDAKTGQLHWQSQPIDRTKVIKSFYLPILVLYENVVLFSGGETAGKQTGSWYTTGQDTMTALSLDSGEQMWKAYHPPSGYRSPEDLLVANGLVWTGETTSGRAVGMFTGRDPVTGEVKSQFEPDVDTYWFHHRCYRGKATDRFLLMGRTGTEFINLEEEHWDINHWVRGACLYGIMPANGLLYAPQHPCACYLEAKLSGFNALAPAGSAPRITADLSDADRLVPGPAFDAPWLKTTAHDPQDWPTYRHDAGRSGSTANHVSSDLEKAWQVKLGGKLTAPVVADQQVFVASVESHTLHAIQAETGEQRWEFLAGGRIDSPPTYYRGRLLFGSADGWVYCLNASNGKLVWRFLAAPMDQRLVSMEQLESVWPVHGSVLVQDDVAYFVAGRSMFLDSGLRLWRLDAQTGKILSKTVLDEYDATGSELHEYVSWLNMPPALPDVLSSNGKFVYMRSQPFDLQGKRQPLEAMPRGADADQGAPPATQDQQHAHLFSPTGFLDDQWWHRSYWLYGSRFISGWSGYYLSGKVAPAGRILVTNGSKVFGFGRLPKYYRWTTPIEHQLFCADKKLAKIERPARKTPKKTVVEIAKSQSLNPADQSITAMAWVKPDRPDGVVIAHGGGAQGYALYIKSGRGHFAVRSAETLYVASSQKKITQDKNDGDWCHLAGVLTANKELLLYVNGQLAGRGTADAPVAANPLEAMEIGADEGSNVGDYEGRFGFAGLIDEVKVYFHGLSADEIERIAQSDGSTTDPPRQAVLCLPFDNGKALDVSGNENHGAITGAESKPGKFDTALLFMGGSEVDASFVVQHHWTRTLPLFARAMLLADQTLFVAGPADLIDEPKTFQQIRLPRTQDRIAEQLAAYEGHEGGSLWAVSAQDGKRLAAYPLDSPPVFDGMAAARGNIYLTTMAGHVVCLKGE